MVLVLVACAATAERAAAATCRATTQGPPVGLQATSDLGERVERSALVLCNRRTGRRRTIARTRIDRAAGRAGSGSFFSDASAAPGRLAYVEVVVGRRSVDRVVAVLLSARTLRVLRRVTFKRGEGLRVDAPEVAVARDGTLAVGLPELRVQLARPGRRPRDVGPFVHQLAFEDHATLRWQPDFYGELTYLDLRRPPVRDGCPVRAAFSEVARTPRLRLSRSTRGGTAVRVCDLASGRDPVVLSAGQFGDRTDITVSAVGASGSTVFVARTTTDRDDVCGTFVLRVGFGLTEDRRSWDAESCGLVPAGPVPVVVGGPGGAGAWILPDVAAPSGTREDRLVGLSGDWVVVLDAGPSGTITDLRGTPDGVAWRAAGDERSASLS